MRKERARLLAALVSIAPLLGCSVMGLDDFGGAQCTSDADCVAAKSLLAPTPASCGDPVCRGGVCQWQEGVETCDGKDNDCDDLIDEDLDFGVGLVAAVKAVETEPSEISYAFGSDSERNFVAVAVDGNGQGFTLPADGVARSGPFTLVYQSESAPPSRCPIAVSPQGAECNFSQVALAADGKRLLFASINTLGCAAGQLRVGLSNLDAPFTVLLGKAGRVAGEEWSNIEFGVSLDKDGSCSGPAGATRPAVASAGTNGTGAGALVVWLAASARDSDERVGPVPVEGLGLVVQAGAPEWLDGTNEGTPMELGRTTGRSPPAVVARESGDYLVGFPVQHGADQGIQLITVQVAKAKSESKLSIIDSETPGFFNVGPVDQVSLAPGKSGQNKVGLAWRSTMNSQLCFAAVSLSDPLPPSPVCMAVTAPIPAFATQILYQDSGFAMTEPLGGWFLSWVETTSDGAFASRLARVREGTQQLLTQRTLGSGLSAPTLLYAASAGGAADVGYAVTTRAGPQQTDLVPHPSWCQ